MSVLIDFSIFPLDTGNSVSPYVARVVKIIEKSGLPYELGPMGTIIEGSWKEVMLLIDLCFKELETDCSRVYMNIKADYRKDTVGRITSKVASVKSKL